MCLSSTAHVGIHESASAEHKGLHHNGVVPGAVYALVCSLTLGTRVPSGPWCSLETSFSQNQPLPQEYGLCPALRQTTCLIASASATTTWSTGDFPTPNGLATAPSQSGVASVHAVIATRFWTGLAACWRVTESCSQSIRHGAFFMQNV